jgi:hypothetical protein
MPSRVATASTSQKEPRGPALAAESADEPGSESRATAFICLQDHAIAPRDDKIEALHYEFPQVFRLAAAEIDAAFEHDAYRPRVEGLWSAADAGWQTVYDGVVDGRWSKP